mmetsp:Transcript_5394/g.7158  ORF Transcript_5394/g.7158 Transcript_5394/m.7158 type:complete len:212 (-) Transcript_5394:208-843(-)
MTIKIENEALLCVTSSAEPRHSTPPPKPPSSEGISPECIVYFPNHETEDSSDSVPPCLLELDDDEVTTASTCSTFSNSSSSSDLSARRVSWRSCIVSDVRFRPRTPPQDCGDLFYTSEETDEFRRQYRREREIQAERERESASRRVSSPETRRRRHISRVVVLHNDAKETYFSEGRSNGGLNYSSTSLSDTEKDDAFFDNDNFWSGSITWY